MTKHRDGWSNRGVLAAGDVGFAAVDWGKALAWLRARTGAALAAEQEQAVRLALTRRVAVLTRGSGCGKSFTVRSVITLAAANARRSCWRRPPGERRNG